MHHQSWTCEDGKEYEGHGEFHVPWECNAGPGKYSDGGCMFGVKHVVVEGAVARKDRGGM